MGNLRELWARIVFRLFIWSGTRFFSYMQLYDPGHTGNIKAIHFAVNEYHLENSVRELTAEHVNLGGVAPH